MYYGARYYDAQLGRFISADTIVPGSANPQALNRYAYVLNNPLRYADPTGHFGDDVIKEYLKREYGDEWEKYWREWQNDKDWMDLLHAARPGDTMCRMVVDANGDASAAFFQFEGEGEDVLQGISSVSGAGRNRSQSEGATNLAALFGDRGKGIGLLRLDSAGDIAVIRTIGDISISVRKAREPDLILTDWAISVSSFAITVAMGNGYMAGFIVASFSGLANRRIGNLPGMMVGDNVLTISVFTPTGAPESAYGASITPGIRSGWDYYFRTGDELSRGGYSWRIYNPYRNYRR